MQASAQNGLPTRRIQLTLGDAHAQLVMRRVHVLERQMKENSPCCNIGKCSHPLFL